MREFIQGLPKVELHLHIEGTLESELMFKLAQRNQIQIPFNSPEEVREAYQFTNLQSFLDIYYQGANVLRHEQDFFDLTWEYLLHCKQDHVMHTELFFDPQTHTARGVPFAVVINGISRALRQAEHELGITSELIMCFLRHLDEDSAFVTLEQALPYREQIKGVGLDSSEQGHPPEKFARVFAKARELGFLTVAHAGEEGPSSNIQDAIDLLGVSRVDHGVRCIENPQLVEQLVASQMPLTVCPLSNTKLKVFADMSEHNIAELLNKNLCVTINSDDPAYFGGYMNDNFFAIQDAFHFTKEQLAKFTHNAINASFCSDERKSEIERQVMDYFAA